MKLRIGKKEEEEMEEEVESDVVKEETPPQVQQKVPQTRHYLMVVNDGESQETLVIKADNILIALSKFAREYNTVCDEWLGLNISIEEVETIE